MRQVISRNKRTHGRSDENKRHHNEHNEKSDSSRTKRKKLSEISVDKCNYGDGENMIDIKKTESHIQNIKQENIKQIEKMDYEPVSDVIENLKLESKYPSNDIESDNNIEEGEIVDKHEHFDDLNTTAPIKSTNFNETTFDSNKISIKSETEPKLQSLENSLQQMQQNDSEKQTSAPSILNKNEEIQNLNINKTIENKTENTMIRKVEAEIIPNVEENMKCSLKEENTKIENNEQKHAIETNKMNECNVAISDKNELPNANPTTDLEIDNALQQTPLNDSNNQSAFKSVKNVSTSSTDYVIVEDENSDVTIYVTRKKRKKKKIQQ